MCFQLEKLMTENSDKIKDSDREPLEKAIEKAREAAKGDDVQAIKDSVSELEQASHAVSKTLYETAQTPGADPAGATAGAPNGDGAATADEDTIDAEFEVKDS